MKGRVNLLWSQPEQASGIFMQEEKLDRVMNYKEVLQKAE